MVPAAPWPWVSSQTSRPDVAQAGVATWPVCPAAPGAAAAAAGTRAAAQANAPAMKNRRAAVVRRFMTYSFAQEGQPGGIRDYVSCSLEQSADPAVRYTTLRRAIHSGDHTTVIATAVRYCPSTSHRPGRCFPLLVVPSLGLARHRANTRGRGI